MNANVRIKRAMLANERAVLREIRRRAKAKDRYLPLIGLTSVARYNAIERLVKKGRIRWRQHRWLSGYEEVAR